MSARSVDATTLVPLIEAAEVRPGLSTGERLQHDPRGSHQVILSRHLIPGQPYTYRDEHEFRISPDRDATRYALQRGDVLFMSRGSRNVASWIESVPDPTVAPVSFYLLRPKPFVDPGYLVWFLNQPTMRRAIADTRTGAGTPIVQRGAFSALLIPVPDLQTQRTISTLAMAMVDEARLLESLATATSQMHDLTSEQIARELLARTENPDGK